LPAKHVSPQSGYARVVLSAAVALLVILVVWAAARAVGPASAARMPWVEGVSPASDLIPPPFPSRSPSSSPSVPPVSAGPSSRTTARSSAPARTRSPSASPSRSSASASPAGGVTATVSVGLSSTRGYVATVQVRNSGAVARTWSVTVTHRSGQNVTLRDVWGASGSGSGRSLTFTGGPLAPGASAGFGYRASSRGRSEARPAACSAVGGRCEVR
jgi:hypothetical protein